MLLIAQGLYITEWQKETATEANGQTAAEPTEMDLGITATGIYSEMAYVYHRYACFTPIQIPSTDKDLIVSVLETGHGDHHVGNTHFFLVDEDGVGVKDGTLADQSQAGRRGYNSLAPNTVYKPSMMNIGSCQNMLQEVILWSLWKRRE